MSRRLMLAAAAGLVGAFGCEGGCQGNSTTPFDPTLGYQELEPCTAPFPAPVEGDPHPETIVTTTGTAPGPPGHHWAHGAGFVHAPIDAVWAALQDPMVSRIHGPDTSVTLGVEPEYPLSFEIRYEDGPIYARVHWVIRYRGGPLDDADPPRAYGLRYQKIEGTDYIPVQSGSLVATDAGDGVTALQLVCWLDAHGQGPENVRGTVTDWYADVLAAVHPAP